MFLRTRIAETATRAVPANALVDVLQCGLTNAWPSSIARNMNECKIVGCEQLKIILSIVAVLLILMGAIWALQGLGVVGGSFMVGQTRWLYIGLLTMVVGVGLLFVGRRNRP